jgi:hypothetical protein
VPRAARGHYAAGVWADLTGQVVTKELAAQISAQPGANDVPAGLSEQERGAYQLIYGNS